ncbi:type II toxin-antitoxin system VapB family antitoxin [Psychrobacter pygoscelis]|uniref:type II toxin-antitoxin system VapB family antitoxin n=1 Tax=Psychrobacter pygoscelis TaxID=2488563 RepID=UPI001038ECD8|nr:type II toxin-antitoxin system VapB family antitoxin [Psychrobacter pygoscelis]
MRTNIIIDDDLMTEAQRLTGIKTKKDTVDEALKLLVRMQKQRALRKFRGKLQWDGDLDEMRMNVEALPESSSEKDI